MTNVKILWADDEIDLLRPQLMFLEKRGYEVTTVTNGHDAIEVCSEMPDLDIVFLDESMPGLTGLETLSQIKVDKPHLPVVMITKNEAENIMDEAIGSQISDYLIKPVNPNQILLSLKRIIDNKRLVSEKTTTDYQQEFQKIFMKISGKLNHKEWAETYKKLINWELKLSDSDSHQLGDILQMQKSEANAEFSKYIVRNYESWFKPGSEDNRPTLSHELFRQSVAPVLVEGKPTFFILLDNLRYDQWQILRPIISQVLRIEEENHFYSILPTSTQYSRNAIFAGMMPSDIAKHYPEWWLDDNEQGGKNMQEANLLGEQLKRLMRKTIKYDYIKVTNVRTGKEMLDNSHNYLQNDLTVIVYNFIDMLSHARTEMEVLKELASDEKAYRSLTRSWFLHSPIWSTIQLISEYDVNVVIATDHGTVRVNQPAKVVGDRETTTNLRYKVGRNLQYSRKDVLEIKDPVKVGLPRPNLSSKFIFAIEDKYFLYPNNYNYYNNYFRNTFQHGGISLEELICPVIKASSKKFT